MHIALLSSTAMPSSGWGRYTVDYCHALAAFRDVTFTLYVQQGDPPQEASGMPSNVVPSLPRWRPTLRGAWDTFRDGVGLTAQCRRPDVVHALVEFPYAMVAQQLATSVSAPYVVSLHGTYASLPFRDPDDGRVYGRALAEAGAITAPSRYTADALRGASGRDLSVEVMPNPVDLARFTEVTTAAGARRHLGLPEHARLVLSVGEVKPRKGFDTLLIAFEEVSRRLPDTHLVLAGPGHTAPVTAFAAKVGVPASSLHILGEVSEALLTGLFHACDVFCLLPFEVDGKFEGYGLVYLEAGACGKPVVATRSGGVPDAVLDGETGLLVEERDAHAAADAIVGLLEDRALAQRLGEGNRRLAASRPWSTYAAGMIEIYKRLCLPS
jgi:phosphatidylinositol alpha-1,6-mannosyltransferase